MIQNKGEKDMLCKQGILLTENFEGLKIIIFYIWLVVKLVLLSIFIKLLIFILLLWWLVGWRVGLGRIKVPHVARLIIWNEDQIIWNGRLGQSVSVLPHEVLHYQKKENFLFSVYHNSILFFVNFSSNF